MKRPGEIMNEFGNMAVHIFCRRLSCEAVARDWDLVNSNVRLGVRRTTAMRVCMMM